MVTAILILIQVAIVISFIVIIGRNPETNVGFYLFFLMLLSDVFIGLFPTTIIYAIISIAHIIVEKLNDDYTTRVSWIGFIVMFLAFVGIMYYNITTPEIIEKIEAKEIAGEVISVKPLTYSEQDGKYTSRTIEEYEVVILEKGTYDVMRLPRNDTTLKDGNKNTLIEETIFVRMPRLFSEDALSQKTKYILTFELKEAYN